MLPIQVLLVTASLAATSAGLVGGLAPVPAEPEGGPAGVRVFLGGLSADYLDDLDSAQFLRSDVNDTMAADLRVEGDLAVTGRAAATEVCIAAVCQDSWPAGAFDQLQGSRGRVHQFTFSGNPTSFYGYGLTGGSAGSPEPRILLGSPTAPETGFMPQGTVVTIGAAYLLVSKATCCQSSGLVVVDGPVDIVKYSHGDTTHPDKLRVRYTSDATGLTVEEDWTTYADGDRAYFEMRVVAGGASGSGQRVVEVTLAKDGAASKTITGVRHGGGVPVVSGFSSATGSANAHNLLAAAGKIEYP